MKHEDDVALELGRLPRLLKDSYDINYTKISRLGRFSRSLAISVLQWLLCSQRPLSSRELIAAISLRPRDQQLEVSHLQILDICGNFVKYEVVPDRFQLAHLSIREYLETREEFEEGLIHALAFDRCLETYSKIILGRNSGVSIATCHQHFFTYAIRYWADHFQTLRYCGVDLERHEAARGLISQLCHDTSEKPEQQSRSPQEDESQLYRDLQKTSNQSSMELATRMLSTTAPTLHKSSKARVPIVWVPFCNRNPATNTLYVEGQGTIYNPSVEEFIEAMGPTGVVNKFHTYPNERSELSLAAEAGQISSFCAQGWDEVDVPDSTGRTPLSYAAGAGHDRIVCILLSLSVKLNVSAPDAKGQTPMWWAIKGGNETVTWLLKSEKRLSAEDRSLLWDSAPEWALREAVVRRVVPSVHPSMSGRFRVSKTSGLRFQPVPSRI